MYVLIVEMYNEDIGFETTHKMAVGPFESIEAADRYFVIGRYGDHDDYFGYEVVAVNPPTPELLAKAVLNPEVN